MRTILIAALLVPTLAQAQAADARTAETMAVCDSMTIYVQSANRHRAMGMPVDEAKRLAAGLMEKNLKMDSEIKAGAIGLVMEIYSYVYTSPSGKEVDVDAALTNTCGKYRGYGIPAEVVARHVATTAQSAWDPLVRVPVCVKVAQTASNIATARDRGMPRDRIAEVVTSALANDKFTSSRQADLIAQAYENPDVEVAQLYGFSLAQCRAQVKHKPYPVLLELKPDLLRCKGETSKEERAACNLKMLRLKEET